MQQNFLKNFSFLINPLKNQKLNAQKTLINKSLNVIKTNQAFRGYAMSYKVELIERKYPITQLEASKSSIKDLISTLLNETKGFKYQMTVKVLL